MVVESSRGLLFNRGLSQRGLSTPFGDKFKDETEDLTQVCIIGF